MQSYLKSNEKLDHYDELSKATFLSYFISLYISTGNVRIGTIVFQLVKFMILYKIYKTNWSFKVPHVDKRDISLCFYILDKLGLCSCLK